MLQIRGYNYSCLTSISRFKKNSDKHWISLKCNKQINHEKQEKNNIKHFYTTISTEPKETYIYNKLHLYSQFPL